MSTIIRKNSPMWIAVLVAVPYLEVRAAVQEFTNTAQWQSAAGAFTTIGFDEIPPQNISNQYLHLGVDISGAMLPGWPGTPVIYSFADTVFLNDGYGIGVSPSHTAQLVLSFAAPMNSIGASHPGGLEISLYTGETLMHRFFDFGSGLGNFIGLVSDTPFDRALIWDPEGGTFIDDLHFGPPIPAPCAVFLFGMCAVKANRKRRA